MACEQTRPSPEKQTGTSLRASTTVTPRYYTRYDHSGTRRDNKVRLSHVPLLSAVKSCNCPRVLTVLSGPRHCCCSPTGGRCILPSRLSTSPWPSPSSLLAPPSQRGTVARAPGPLLPALHYWYSCPGLSRLPRREGSATEPGGQLALF